jgi:hypothetical protein
MKVCNYEPVVFSNLSDFHLAENFVEPQQKHLPKLGQIIRKHNLENSIGVCLLHKHFNLFSDEILVRTFENNAFDISPKAISATRAMPYMWAFSKSVSFEETSLYPVEFLQVDASTEKFEEKVNLLYRHDSFREEFLKELDELNLREVFGLSLIPHELFNLGTDETLLENDTPGERNLKIKVAAIATIKSSKTTQTLWKFNNVKGESGMQCLSHCSGHCGNHCGGHCGVHCGVHCAGHCLHD